MSSLSPTQKQFIDENFYEGFGNLIRKEKFNQLTTPQELHYLAEQHNWDDGVDVLQWVVESEQCSEATALMLFWLAQPREFIKYKLTFTFGNIHENQVFQLIKTILENFTKGVYKKTDIHFDPVTVNGFPPLQVPAFMRLATKGEETYIYFEKKEVDGWFLPQLENKIKRCDNALELFNIASFIKIPDKAKLILNSQLCDKGIAVMLFWKLMTYAYMWHETSDLLTEIIEKVDAKEYPEVLSYDPTTDTQITMNVPKPKWAIPEMMTRPV
ncbi:DUF4274 domain-containing protein [Chitinophaga sp. RAB17]|uniref:DUF4274 domain-containing protein n=1 Tax=Chitinophaga sp. RAB17 TaxID=3233049 RepID=UPI003F90D83D